MQVQRAGEERDQRGHQSYTETNQKEDFPIHFVSPPFATAALPRAPGFKTCNKRSTIFGVSRIAPSSTTHLRESSCRASSSNASLTSGSRLKRSAPLINQRSNLSSMVCTSET